MRYHWTFKTLAFLLALLAGCCLVLSAAGVVYLVESDGFFPSDQFPRLLYQEELRLLAKDKLREYYLRENAHLPKELLVQYNHFPPYTGLADAGLQHQVLVGDDTQPTPPKGTVAFYAYETTMVFPKAYKLDNFNYPTNNIFHADSSLYKDLAWRGPDGQIIPSPTPGVTYWISILEDGCRYRIDMVERPCAAYIYASLPTAAQLTAHPMIYAPVLLLQTPFGILAAAIVSLLVLLGSCVYLCCAAGRGPKVTQPTPRGLHKLPMDLALVLSGGIIIALVQAVYSLLCFSLLTPFLILAFLLCSVIGLVLLVLMTTFAAQVKTPGHYLLKRSVVGFVVTRLWKLLRFVVGKVMVLAKAGVRIGQKIYTQLPLMVQWLITGGVLLLLLTCGFISGFQNLSFLPIAVSCLVFAGVICYGSYCFSLLLGGAKKIRSGALKHQIPSSNLLGCFREFANELNSLGQTVEEASQKRMQSERMKSELITNVSHDLKTPLTSLINYVDLLQMPHTPEEQDQYLEVLQRQSNRMKKLIEDLTEMSKANSGVIAVCPQELVLQETVHQALGEFSDKLYAAGLSVVCRMPQEELRLQADGKLLWRVLSNLLSNACKYSLAGTRLYVDVTESEGLATVRLRNISREELTISEEELMERFVRGDASRNTEGSGLGLNIARSLMELQKGTLDIRLDGDLFTATMSIPLH